MSLDDITALVASMKLEGPQKPPATSHNKKKQYNAVPPPKIIQPSRRSNIPSTRSSHARNSSNSQNQRDPQIPKTNWVNPSTVSPQAQHGAPSKSMPKLKPPLRSSPKVFIPESPSQPPSTSLETPSPSRVYIMLLEPFGSGTYGYRTIVGVFSSLGKATTEVADTFGIREPSRRGLNGIMVYDTLRGRVEVVPLELQRRKSEDAVPENGEVSAGRARGANAGKEATDQTRAKSLPPEIALAAHTEGGLSGLVYLALDDSLCIGAFTEKAPAWAACRKHQAQISYCGIAPMKERSDWVDNWGLPHASGRIEGGGWHHWFVEIYALDEMVGGMSVKERFEVVEKRLQAKAEMDVGFEGIEITANDVVGGHKERPGRSFDERLTAVERRLRELGVAD